VNSVSPLDRFLLSLSAAATPVRVGAGALAATGTTVFVIEGLGAGPGLGGLAAALSSVGVFWVVGALMQASERAHRRDEAFVWRGQMADGDPLAHFNVQPARHRDVGEIPAYIRRNAEAEVLAGLESRRLVVITGPRSSGRSRLVYQALSTCDPRNVLVSASAPTDGADDHLVALLKDPKGLRTNVEPTVLVIRDYAARLIAKRLSVDALRRWLDREPTGAVIVTFSTTEVQHIRERGGEDLQEFEALQQQGEPVSVPLPLVANERAAAEARFPDLTPYECEYLPAYFCSALLLRDRFRAGRAAHPVGYAAVRAVANWQRAGADFAAPLAYIAREVRREHGDAGIADIMPALDHWACECVADEVSSLIRKEQAGYVADKAIVDVLDEDEGIMLPDHTWESVTSEAICASAGDHEVRAVTLLNLGFAAVTRDAYTVATKACDLVEELTESQPEAVEALRELIAMPSAQPVAGSPEALLESVATDSVLQRLGAVDPAVEEADAVSTPPGRFVNWIYARRSVRWVARLLALVGLDVVSLGIGVGLALFIRASVDEQSTSAALSATWRYFPLWIAATVIAYGRIGLYKADSPRARFSPILVVGLSLGTIGIVAAFVGRPQLGAVLGGLAGLVVGVLLNYGLRASYDSITQAVVHMAGLQTRTLLVGNGPEIGRVATVLGRTRGPTSVVGYLGAFDQEAAAATKHLGDIAALPDIIQRDVVARVIVTDPAMDRARRQHVADICHELRVPVDAVASLWDIRAGAGEFIPGHSVVLIRLQPLWLNNGRFVMKRTVDVLVAVLALIPLGLLAMPLALAAWREHDRVLVRHKRHGRGGRVFHMYRFRTTAPGVPSDPNDGLGERAASRLAGFLRKRGLDDLPQLLNVLVGEMSLVGPRPLHEKDDAQLESGQRLRYLVCPGATGPWLISEHTDLSLSELAALDFAYLQNWSLVKDFDILLRTLSLMVRGRSEYPRVTNRDTPHDPKRRR
jgi:lipopolysaccharide/colanic/teichoic acid biosynthesis glycosyltransferase